MSHWFAILISYFSHSTPHSCFIFWKAESYTKIHMHLYVFKLSVMASVFFFPIWTNAHHLLVWPRRVLIYSASLSAFQLSHYATWKHTNIKCHKRIACIHVLAIPLTSGGKRISVSISIGYEQMPIYKWLHSGYYFFFIFAHRQLEKKTQWCGRGSVAVLCLFVRLSHAKDMPLQVTFYCSICSVGY